MKILITSGGTRIPIDPVRFIGNHSKGTFGSAIAEAALSRDHEVVFLHAKDSKIPQDGWIENLDYESPTYSTFDQYAAALHQYLTEQKFDAVVLAAAVSDYGVIDPPKTKIRTEKELSIKLFPLPKLISLVKQHQPDTFLVGFKMLVGATNSQLLEAAAKTMATNDCNLVIANNWKETNRAIVMAPSASFWPLSSETDSPLFSANNLIGLIECGISSLQQPAQ